MRVFLISHAVSNTWYVFIRTSGDLSYFTFIRYIGVILRRESRPCGGSSFDVRMDNPCLVYGMITVPTLGPIPAPHTFRSSSDVLYGRSAVGAERPILIPSTAILLLVLEHPGIFLAAVI